MSDGFTDPATLAAPDRATFVAVNRTRLRVWEWGEPTAPPVIAVHGAHDHGRMWDELAPRVADLGFHVRAIDVRGHGESGRLASGHTWNAAVLDLAGLAMAEGRKVGLLAHSMGGGQALTFAATFPELAAWIINVDGLGPPDEAFPDTPISEAATDALDRLDLGRERGTRVWASLDEMVQRRAATNVRLPRPWVEHLVRHGHIEVDGGYSFLTDSNFNHGLPDGFSVEHAIADFDLVDVPTLVLTGDQQDTWSELDDKELGRRLDKLSAAAHTLITGGGHYCHIEQPEQTFEAIEAFLEDIDAPGHHEVLQVPPLVAPPAEGHRPVIRVASHANADRAPAAPDNGPRVVVLHSVGEHAGGGPWRDAPGWPGRVTASDLDGHADAPFPTGGHFEAGDVVFQFAELLSPRAGVTAPIVVGVGTSGYAALLFALAGRASGVVLVNGLGAPLVPIVQRVKAQRLWRRGIAADKAAVRSLRSTGPDPRAAHGVCDVMDPVVEEALAALTVPILVIETPDSLLSEDESVARAAHAAAVPTRLPATDPAAVASAVTEWCTAHA